MQRFEPVLRYANIEVVDLPVEVELNGVLIYMGDFPHGGGRLMLHPSLARTDGSLSVAVVAHELAHLLLARFTNHPASVLQMLYDPTQRRLYDRYEAEADNLAACLLVPPELRAACPSPRYPTPARLARALGVPTAVVQRALAQPKFDHQPIREFLQEVTGFPHFALPYQVLAA